MTDVVPVSDGEIARMRQLRDQGWSYRSIAEEVGRSRSVVRYWVNPDYRRQHIERPARPVTAESRAKDNARRAERRNRRRADPEWREAERAKERERRKTKWATDPRYRAKKAAEQRRRNQRAAEALRLVEREKAIIRAVRKTGAATQEAWAMAERMQDVLAQAQRETEDREAKRALSEAGVHYRKMRDEIVRALGVA